MRRSLLPPFILRVQSLRSNLKSDAFQNIPRSPQSLTLQTLVQTLFLKILVLQAFSLQTLFALPLHRANSPSIW